MEFEEKNKIYSLTKQVEYLKSIINDLEIELFKHRCLNQKVTSKKLSKKQELLSSLEYLKNKKVKTKQDRDSIYIIEMVLKSMS
jgi:hypothetical protein